jgi:pilus assembly protein CpaC
MTRTRVPFLRSAVSLLALAAIATPAASAQDAARSGEVSRIIHISANAPATPQQLTLGLNKAVVIELERDARDVFVANPTIADAVVRTPRRIFLMSLKIGQTNAIFLDASGRQIAAIEIVVGADVDDLSAQIASQIPDGKVRVQALNDNVILSGSVNNVQEASRAQDMAARFTGDPDKVVNNIGIEQRQQVLIQVRVSEMSRTISKQLGINVSSVVNAAGVPFIASTDNQFSLVGRALSDMSGVQVGQVCRTTQFVQRTIGDADVQPPPEVLAGRTAIGIIPGTNIGGTGLGFSPTNLCRADPNNVQSTLRALERVGLVRTLAEPNLTAISGESAKFLAGGEFPVPASRDRDGNITVEFKPFGVGLSFTPVVLSRGRISLQISSEVSELTNTGALTLAGTSITDSNGNTITQSGLTLPALSVRRTETTVEIPSGGSLAIGGLIQQQTKQNLDGLPGAKDLPVLGALFRSRDFQNNETELVVTVTAYLVNPVAPNQLTRPDDGYAVPTDLEATLMGRLNAVYGKDKQLPEVPKSAVGYIVP